MNQPVRILFSNQKKMDEHYPGGMELMATSIQMDVERKFNPIPIPLGGGARFGIDMNSVNSAIQIEGVLTDDDPAGRTVSGTKAVAEFDVAFDSSSNVTVGALQAVTTSNYASARAIGISVGGVEWRIFLSETHGSASIGDVSFESLTLGTSARTANVRIFVSSGPTYATAPQVATAIASAINNTSQSGWEMPFTASVLTSKLKPSVGATLVSIEYDEVGSAGNDAVLSQSSLTSRALGSPFKFHSRDFSGGRDKSSAFARSAGDKLQDLYGIVHNTQKPGSSIVAGAAIGAGAAALTVATGGAAAIAGAALFGSSAGYLAGGGLALFVDGDYPSQLIIPYNSMLTADSGELYSVRHLRLALGLGKRREDKLSTTNTSTKQNDGDDIAIRGGIKSLTLGHQAGETIYSFRMTYLPVNILL